MLNEVNVCFIIIQLPLVIEYDKEFLEVISQNTCRYDERLSKIKIKHVYYFIPKDHICL